MSYSHRFYLDPPDMTRLMRLCGENNHHLHTIETQYTVTIHHRGHAFLISGTADNVKLTVTLLQKLYADMAEHPAEQDDLEQHLTLTQVAHPDYTATKKIFRTKHRQIELKTPHQQQYIDHIFKYDLNFGVGPAGTGKTYLAVAAAVQALENNRVERIILARPAVEAGERLGFLPGDMAQKVDPYLRPLYDALYDLLGVERVSRLIEKHTIEIAPLAYMRGRTLNDAFIILDESQNTTIAQMKMFLTRMGYNSLCVITGDMTQIDLPRNITSGLAHALSILKEVPGIGMTAFLPADVLRHGLVQHIVQAYENDEKRQDKSL